MKEPKRTFSLAGRVEEYILDDDVSPSDSFHTITNSKGDKYWFKCVGTDTAGKVLGVFHREDGPALMRGDWKEEWYLDGRRHRLDGPAILYHDLDPREYNVWWVHGRRISSLKDYQKKTDCSDEHLTALKLKWGEIT